MNYSEQNFVIASYAYAQKTIALTIFAGGSIPVTSNVDSGANDEDNDQISQRRLRFIRHLLVISQATKFGFIPNFYNIDAVYEVARQFIHYCGNASLALHTMAQIMEQESNI